MMMTGKSIRGLLSLIIALYSLSLFAAGEYDIDQTASTNTQQVSILNVINEYLSTKQWQDGKNTSKGKVIFIASGVASVAAPINHKGYIQSRQNAFDKAMLDAKAKMAEFMGVSIQTDLESYYSEPSESRQQAENEQREAAANRLEAGRDIAIAQNSQFAEDHGSDMAFSIADKTNALLVKEVANRLKSLGYDPDKPASEQVLKKITTEESFKKHIITAAKHRITGVQAFKTFEVTNSKGQTQIGVVAMYTKNLGDVAKAIYTSNTEGLAKQKPKKPLREQLPKDDVLISTFGVRQAIDENGNYAILAYAQSAPVTDSPRSLQAASEKSRLEALGLIRQYAGEIVMVSSEQEKIENSQTFDTGESSYEYSEEYLQQIKTSAEAINIKGLSTLRQWTSVHPHTKHPIAGSVVYWTIDSSRAADGLKKEMNSNPSPATSTYGSSAKGSYYNDSDEADDDAF